MVIGDEEDEAVNVGNGVSYWKNDQQDFIGLLEN